MTQDQYHPIPGETEIEIIRNTYKNYLKTNRIRITDTGYQDKMEHITDSLMKERDELKEKLGVALTALALIRTHQQISVGANNSLMYKLSTTWNIANSVLEKIGEDNK